MSKNTSWGRLAYKEVRKSGGSKEKARKSQKVADEKYLNHLFSKSKNNYSEDLYSFNNSKNEGCWHTSEDL